MTELKEALNTMYEVLRVNPDKNMALVHEAATRYAELEPVLVEVREALDLASDMCCSKPIMQSLRKTSTKLTAIMEKDNDN